MGKVPILNGEKGVGIVQDPHPSLRAHNEKVDARFVKSNEFKDLILHMHEMMLEANGVGIAAPQVGVNKQVALIRKDYTPYPHDHLSILINPDYMALSETLHTMDEGCLSVERGEKAVRVPRYAMINVVNEVLQYDGTLKTVETQISEPFLARIIQHEVQHLNGILFTDMQLDV